MTDIALHAGLVGQPGSRDLLNTPVLVVDRTALEANIATMAAFAAGKGLKLRPHAKTHKSADIARLQLAAGAAGLCCAKIGEAEALAAQGVSTGLLITSPVVSAPAVARLAALNLATEGLKVVVDHPANVAALGAATSASGKPLEVLIDLDPGIHRTGVASPQAAVSLFEAIKGESALTYAGLQCYCGVQQHIEAFDVRKTALEDRGAYIREVIDALTAAGGAPPIVSGSGTGSHRIDAELSIFTELQVGSYVFMDDQYLACDLAGEGADASPYRRSLFIDARVVSANSPGMVTVDAGFKAMSTDADPPQVVAGAPEGSRYFFMGDEHGALVPSSGSPPPLGARVTLAAPHCDPTVNLYDAYHVVEGDTLVAVWPVTARGRSR
ncbi:DSD1 family PLP-dependent enzyme [Caulobacter sp. 602-2]|uniref:DSD1 family PLP-dependent enzyme n=1 Tax=Caulobacter sp. 602-2 TaxID=2710887 RepID=A0A6G4QXV5_9CAUL|nr:DSD1 family PLP-dependent enzyme [Caulobacter sp. 602-2]NGM50371.1 DSD1 family PLP-dependent enzyme [Caulobacter sp. 602-2]